VEDKAKRKIRILVVDDSEVVRVLLKAIFEYEDDMEVIATAENGQEAIQKAHELKPDVITMDIRMPVLNGFEAIKAILKEQSIPILVVSGAVDDEDVKVAFRALEVGALGVVEKPKIITETNFRCIGKDLVVAVRNVVELCPCIIPPHIIKPVVGKKLFKLPAKYKIVVLGCSTGGPIALQAILSSLPVDFPIPIVVVQHMAVGFTSGFVSWLQDFCALKLKVAVDGERLKAGTVYFAPDEKHCNIIDKSSLLVVSLTSEPADLFFRPSIDALFSSVAKSCPARAIGGLLTGMGHDGAQGLLEMRKNNCLTFVQDKKSCVIYGMPYYALSHGGAKKIVSLEKIASYLLELV
jgi:two-component system, chemotaxis family, protein-glutamate methylesterase/glutaminase